MWFFSKTLEGLKYSVLSGPELFTYVVIKLPNGRLKKMVIMGEAHSRSVGCGNFTGCIDMVNYIKKLAGEKCIDIFIEKALGRGQGYQPFDTREYYKADEPAEETMGEVRDLTDSLTKNKNIRVQNWDLRFNDYYGVGFNSFTVELKDNLRGYKSFRKLDNRYKLTFIKYLIGYEDVKPMDFINVMSLTKYKITQKMLEELKIVRAKINKEYRKFKKTEHEYFPRGKIPLRDLFVRKTLDRLNISEFEMGLPITDFYALIRMFRTFGNKKKGSCIGEPYSDRIVYYAGRMHSENILGIITYYYPNSVKCVVSNPMRKLLFFRPNLKLNEFNRFQSFSDFLSWPN